MAIVCTSSSGWLISHQQIINKNYSDLKGFKHMKHALFNIKNPYITRKYNLTNNKREQENINEPMIKSLKEDILFVKNTFSIMLDEFKDHFKIINDKPEENDALVESSKIYEATSFVIDALGSNIGPSVKKKINDNNFLFPSNCVFFSKNVNELSVHIGMEKFDLILLDPPWWNKYIRRKRKKTKNQAYDMMYNHELQDLPIKDLLNESGLIVVWCTNSLQNLNALKSDIFPAWNVNFIGRWFWLKVTQKGEPVTTFSSPNRKQPFEQIIFACKSERNLPKPPDNKIVISIPSALHSHKPPLVDLLGPYLCEQPKCLELFARYLLPNWTSFGNEVLKFQHESLFKFNDEN